MNARIILFLSIFVILCSAQNANALSSLTHAYDEIDLFQSCSYYPIKDFDTVAIYNTDMFSIDSKKSIIGDIGIGTKEYLQPSTCHQEVIDKIPTKKSECNPVYDKSLTCIDWPSYANKTMCYYALIKYECKLVDGYNHTKKVIDVPCDKWLTPTDFMLKGNTELKKIKAITVRYCTPIKRQWTKNGYEISVDIIPKLEDKKYDKLNWLNSSWGMCQEFWANSTVVNGNISGIVLPIVLDNSTGIYNGSYGWKDIRFSNQSCNGAGGISLPYEIELVNSTTAVFHVRFPFLDNDTDTNFSVYWGNPTAPTLSRNPNPYDNSYTFVSHLNSTGNLSLNVDSSLLAGNGTDSGIVYTTGGKIAGSIYFDVAHYNHGVNPAWEGNSALTYMGWFFFAYDNACVTMVSQLGQPSMGHSKCGWLSLSCGFGWYSEITVGGNQYTNPYISAYDPDTNYRHYTTTYDGNYLCVYVNGVLTKNTTIGGSITSCNDIDLKIGWGPDNVNSLNGSVDDLQILNRTMTYYEIKAYYDASVNNLFVFSTTTTELTPPNQPSNEIPYNNSGAIPPVTLSVTVDDPTLKNMDVTFINGSDDTVIGVDFGVVSGGTASVVWNIPFVIDQNYTWYVNISNDVAVTTSGKYSFLASDVPNIEDMRTMERNKTTISFEWNNPPDMNWVALYVKEEATTVRTSVVVKDNWTVTGLKFNTVYNFSWQVGDTFGIISPYFSYLVRTDGWIDNHTAQQYKRLITVNGISSDVENYVVNITLNETNFDFSYVNDTINGNDFRAANFEETTPLEVNVTYMNVTVPTGIQTQIVPNDTSCSGDWVDCNKTYDTDMNTFGSPNLDSNATVYFNYTVPTGAKYAKWNVKDGEGYGWGMNIPDYCFSGDTELKLRAVASHNNTQVIWQCQSNTNQSWITMRKIDTYYYVHYTEVVWYYKATAYLMVNVGHLDGNYSTRFYIYYGAGVPSGASAFSMANVWKDVTIGNQMIQETPSPVITNFNVYALNSTAINGLWNVSLTSDSYIRYSTNQWFIGEQMSGYDNYTDNPVINISGLATNTIWYFMAVSCAAGNTTNCANSTTNITLGTLPSTPTVTVLNYSENRPNSNATVCVNLVDTNGQIVNLSVKYFYSGTPYEVFNESGKVTDLVSPTISCFTIPVEYGRDYYYLGVAQGNVTTGYSNAYYNQYLNVTGCFAGDPIFDDISNRARNCIGYREGVCHKETFMWIETNITDMGTLHLHWWNGAWSDVAMSNTPKMWYVQMNNLNNQTWYSFEIWNTTSMLVNYTKPSLDHPLNQGVKMERRYVSFGCTPKSLNYSIYYLDGQSYYNSVYRWCVASGANLYECMGAEYWGGGRENGLGPEHSGYDTERGEMFRGGITNGESYDTGVLNPNRGIHTNMDYNKVILPSGKALNYGETPSTSEYDGGIPGGTDQYRYCFAFLDFWFNDTIVPADGIRNYYTHYWHSDDIFSIYFWHQQPEAFHYISLFQWEPDSLSYTRDFHALPEAMITNPSHVLNTPASTFNSTYTESLSIYQKTLSQELTFHPDTQNIYDYGFHVDGMWNNIMYGQHQQAYIIFNVPDNATLAGLDTDNDGLNDFQELYAYHTNPFFNDTDEGGITDGQEVSLGLNANIWTDDDLTPPSLNIIYPTNGTTIYSNCSSAFTIYGTATDNYHVNSIAINDTAWTFSGTPNNWLFSNASVSCGTYEISITATDDVGNNASKQRYFTVVYGIPPSPPPVKSDIPLATRVILSMIMIAGGIMSFVGFSLYGKRDLRQLTYGMIFLLIVVTLAIQFIIM